jgi:hypothetical protein
MPTNTKKCFLSNGLCVLNVKKKTNELVLLSLTDFHRTGKFIFDTVEKKVIRSVSDLKLVPADIDIIQACIKGLEKTPVIKEASPVAVGS